MLNVQLGWLFAREWTVCQDTFDWIMGKHRHLLQTQKPLLLSVNRILGRGAFSVSVKTSVSLHCSSAEEHRGNQEGSML